ncbi:MAG TPA: glycogen debranching N-terminal domain-containing protein [Pilimelia sp.]|nr:glycogen debranching N-terminal domain-containing protein [Pilimelia sp.]
MATGAASEESGAAPPFSTPPPLDPFGGGGPPISEAAGEVTLVEGATFCLSGGDGDLSPGTTHGLFVRDARLLSRWQLRLDGQRPQSLSVHAGEAYTARFVARRPPAPGLADSTLLVQRERLIGDGLRETITLENLDREPTTATVTLHVDGDFADLFAVKEGRAAGGGVAPTATPDGLVLTSRADPGRGLRISASGQAAITTGSLSWRVALPARGTWTAEVVVTPVLDGRPINPRFQPGERAEDSAAARERRAWRATTARPTAQDPALAQLLARARQDLGALRIADPDNGRRPFVAAGAPWFMTLFGRDSLLTAWMALPLDVDLALGTLQTLAARQGRRVDPATEEEPGRIMHELRSGPDSDRTLGGNHYYGTADATPLFVMLLAECWRWGADERAVRALLPSADAALRWLEEYGDRDGDGFVEYRRATERGLANQGWKDSFDGISHADGRLAEAPIALCEVQGYAYAAWLARAELAEHLEGDRAAAGRLRARAGRLRTDFHERFWLPERGWYALALDGRKHRVESLSSNAAHCLWTGLATDECAAELIGHLASPAMDSGYGLRTLSTQMGAYNPMSYHNGSVWPHDTAIAVAGLLRYAHVPGAVPLAHRLAGGLLAAAGAFGGRLPELYCGFARERFSPPVPYPTSCSPQAWASGAPLLVMRAVLGIAPHVPQRSLVVRPRVPAGWGEVGLVDLRLGSSRVRLSARGDQAELSGLPDDWAYIPHQRLPTADEMDAAAAVRLRTGNGR